MAAKSIPGFSALRTRWTGRAPLGWDTSDPTPVARAAVALLSDLFPATSGSMVMVDGGFHALGVSGADEIQQTGGVAAQLAGADRSVEPVPGSARAPAARPTVGRRTLVRTLAAGPLRARRPRRPPRPGGLSRTATASGRSTSSTAAIS